MLLAVSFASCKRSSEGRADKRSEGNREEVTTGEETKEQSTDQAADPKTFAVPIQSCTCTFGNVTSSLHAPRGKRILWWLGVRRGDAREIEEISIRSSTGGSVIPAPEDAQMLMACDQDVVVMVREDHAVAWKVPQKGKVATLWSRKLTAPLDATAIATSTLDGASIKRAGCAPAKTTNGAIDIPLRDGKHASLAISHGMPR